MKTILKTFLLAFLFFTASCELVPSDTQIVGEWEPILYDFQEGEIYSYNVQSAQFISEGNLIHFEVILTDITTTGTPSNSLYILGLPGLFDVESGVNVFLFSIGNQTLNVNGRITSINGNPVIHFFHAGTPYSLDAVLFDEGDVRVSGDYFVN
jgi:hypothetical protein